MFLADRRASPEALTFCIRIVETARLLTFRNSPESLGRVGLRPCCLSGITGNHLVRMEWARFLRISIMMAGRTSMLLVTAHPACSIAIITMEPFAKLLFLLVVHW